MEIDGTWVTSLKSDFKRQQGQVLCWAQGRTRSGQLAPQAPDLHHGPIPQTVGLTELGRAARVLAGSHGACGWGGGRHSFSLPRPTPRDLPTSHTPRHAGHSPSSTIRSPSFREAPCPAQILFIWATRARLPFSLASSSSLAAGLRTHTAPRLLPWPRRAAEAGNTPVTQGEPKNAWWGH